MFFDLQVFFKIFLTATVYCSALPASTLEKKRADSDQIVIIRPGDVLHFGEITVTPLPGKHIKFDAKLITVRSFLFQRGSRKRAAIYGSFRVAEDAGNAAKMVYELWGWCFFFFRTDSHQKSEAPYENHLVRNRIPVNRE